MKKLYALLKSPWGPVVLFVLGAVSYRIVVGVFILFFSFIIMPFVVVKNIKKEYNTKMAILAIIAILTPIVALIINMNFELLVNSGSEISLTSYHVDEQLAERKIEPVNICLYPNWIIHFG